MDGMMIDPLNEVQRPPPPARACRDRDPLAFSEDNASSGLCCWQTPDEDRIKHRFLPGSVASEPFLVCCQQSHDSNGAETNK